MAPTTNFALRPWAQTPAEQESVIDILNRAKEGRGHFRDITEASLQEEIAAEGGLSSSESSSDEGDDENDDARNSTTVAKPTSREDLFAAKHAMLNAMGAAKNEVMLALDVMSLVTSQENSAQARSSMSPLLQKMIPLGTMGVDLWKRMPLDREREAQEATLAANVKMNSLQRSADTLLGAAKRLETNVRRETQYWDQILSVSEQGWNVCRIPGQEHRLGVRFGTVDSAPQFSRRGIAALSAGEDGGVQLDRGVGSKPKALRTVLRKDGRVLGVSKVPSMLEDGETTLEAKIRHARDSLYDEELYHEVIRESRTLTSLGVTVKGSSIRIGDEDNSGFDLQVSLDLVSLDQDNTIEAAGDEQDNLAQVVILAARLLLGQAHRGRLRKRSEVPPPLSEKQKDDRPILPILRPIMSFLLHHSALSKLNAYLSTTFAVLKTAKIEHELRHAALTLPADQQITDIQTLITTVLLRPLISPASVAINPTSDDPAKLDFTLETSLAHAFGPVYKLETKGEDARRHNFTDIPSLASATDALLSSALARTLLPAVQNEMGEWRCDHDVARLSRVAGIGRPAQVLQVNYDNEKGELRLGFASGANASQQSSQQSSQSLQRSRKFRWSATGQAEGSGADEGFWEAGKKCVGSSG